MKASNPWAPLTPTQAYISLICFEIHKPSRYRPIDSIDQHSTQPWRHYGTETHLPGEEVYRQCHEESCVTASSTYNFKLTVHKLGNTFQFLNGHWLPSSCRFVHEPILLNSWNSLEMLSNLICTQILYCKLRCFKKWLDLIPGTIPSEGYLKVSQIVT